MLNATLTFEEISPPTADLAIACEDPVPAPPGEGIAAALRITNGGPDGVAGARVSAEGLEDCHPEEACTGDGIVVGLAAAAATRLTVTGRIPSSAVDAPRFEIAPPSAGR